MLFEVVSPIVFVVEVLPAGSPCDAVLTHRPQQKIVVSPPNPHFARPIANAVGRLPEESDHAEAVSPKVQHAELFPRSNELVQDRFAGDNV
ncbi:MAG TPA: hypothetical protein VGN24_08335 [Rhodanobacter sp.]|jgi:hypothetical protein|nr:hypothetical protein [Rhodanobacter sp.]